MSEDKIWYIALNDEQVGPLSEDEVRAEIDAGQVTGSTYIWREGLDDWVMAENSAEFTDIVTAEMAAFDDFDEASEPDIADVAGESVDAFFASYDAPSSADDEDEASVAAAGGRADDHVPSGVVSSTVASRSDDSVLFSLDELAQTTQRVSQPDDSTTDGSGLIDLSALASTSATLGSSSGAAATSSSAADSGAAASGTSAHTAAPIALAPPKKSALPMVLLGVAVVAILGLLVAIFLLLGGEDDSAPVAEGAQPDATEQTGAEAEEAAKDEEDAEEDAEQAAADADAEEAADEDSDEPEEPEAPAEPEAVAAAKKPSSSSSSKPASKPSKPAPSRSASKPAPSKPAPSKSAPAKSSDGDSVSAALASISGDNKEKEPSAASSSGPAELSNSQIRSTVRRYNSRIQGCKKSADDAGTYRIAFAINPNGRTSQVASRGGGAAGDCVADVVKTMRFPEFGGDTRKLTYTFAIR